MGKNGHRRALIHSTKRVVQEHDWIQRIEGPCQRLRCLVSRDMYYQTAQYLQFFASDHRSKCHRRFQQEYHHRH